MTKNCPICLKESINSKGKCESCNFEIPAFAFFSEEDANKWYEDIVLPEKEKRDYHIKLENQIKETKTLLDASRKREKNLLQRIKKLQELNKHLTNSAKQSQPTVTPKPTEASFNSSPEPPKSGSILFFGGYKWHVLDVQNGKALLLSEKIIEKRPYHSSNSAITWENCTLRKDYLNREFLNTFNPNDRNRIAETRVANNDNPWYPTNGGNTTNDRIFLLSIEEVVKYFGDSGKLKNWLKGDYYINDQYNSARIAKDSSNEASWWWLRSPGNVSNYAAIVLYYGILYIIGDNVDSVGGVRPALWLIL